MKQYCIKLSSFEVVLFTIASAIILEYSMAAYIAMTHDGSVVNYFNNYHEGWFEFFLMLGIGAYVFIKTFRSQEIEAT